MLNVNIGTTVKGAVDDLDKVWGVAGAWKGGGARRRAEGERGEAARGRAEEGSEEEAGQ